MTGASWDAQLVAALWAAAFGAAASPLTLLYGIRLRPVERFAADFLATVLIGAAFFLSRKGHRQRFGPADIVEGILFAEDSAQYALYCI